MRLFVVSLTAAAAISMAFVHYASSGSANPPVEALSSGAEADEQAISSHDFKSSPHPANPKPQEQRTHVPPAETLPFSEVEVTPRLEEAVSRKLEEFPAIRYRVVKVESDLIRQAIANVSADPSTTLGFSLFDDIELESRALQAINYASGPRVGMSTWLGPLQGAQGSLAVHVDVDGRIRANAHVDRQWYQIASLANEPGLHVIVEINRNKLANVALDASAPDASLP